MNGGARPDSAAAAGVERYRDLAKQLIAIFAAIGGLLAAGTQISSLGQLSWHDDRGRLVAAAVALAVALAAVILFVLRALTVLRPLETTLDDVLDQPSLREQVEAHPGLLGGYASLAEIGSLRGAEVSEAVHASWTAVVEQVLDYAGYREMTRRFDAAARGMVVFAVLGAAAIAVFAWAANPPDVTTDPVVEPAPSQVAVALTGDGRAALAGALGRGCVRRPVAALVIGGTARQPLLVALPGAGCAPLEFTLAPRFGALVGSAR